MKNQTKNKQEEISLKDAMKKNR